jgi:ribosomal protein L9
MRWPNTARGALADDKHLVRGNRVGVEESEATEKQEKEAQEAKKMQQKLEAEKLEAAKKPEDEKLLHGEETRQCEK